MKANVWSGRNTVQVENVPDSPPPCDNPGTY